jgi:Flp pilus assembly pilin Flp
MRALLGQIFNRDDAQDIAEYALMLSVIVVIVVSVVMAVGKHASTIFSKAAAGLK